MKKTLLIAVQAETNRAHGRSMLEGIADYALKHADWRLEAVEPGSLTDPARLRNTDGFIVRVMDDATARALERTGKPVIDTYGRMDSGSIPFIRLDDRAIAETAAEYFVEHGFKRCAFCGFAGLRFSEARGNAFARAVRERGGTCEIYDASAGKLRETFIRRERMDSCSDGPALGKWAKALAKPTAVFCCNDMRAFHFLKACADNAINVPREVSVLGVDNDKILCTFSNPPLSSIDTDPFSLGQNAARLLDGMLGRGEAPPAATLHRPRSVAERTSTEAYRVETPWLSDALVYIRRHLGEGISADDLIRHVGYSHTTVGRVFRKELGTSVQQEIIRRRRDLACRLLKETSATAAEIAGECGYPSAQYFAHVFLAHFGVTPDVWRRQT